MYIVEGTRSEIREKIEEQLSHIVRWKKLIVPEINFYIARVAEIEKERKLILFSGTSQNYRMNRERGGVVLQIERA